MRRPRPRSRQINRRSCLALAAGFAVAILVTIITTWALTALELLDRNMLLEERPLTNFIWRPDALSWIVGFLAGVAGMLSLTSAKSGALIGVLISVTTVPAAANAAVAIAYGVADATFPGVVLAAVIGANLYLGGAVAGALAAVSVALLSRRSGNDAGTATAVVLAAGFAFGAALLSAQQGFTRDCRRTWSVRSSRCSRRTWRSLRRRWPSWCWCWQARERSCCSPPSTVPAPRRPATHTIMIDLLALLFIQLVVVVAVPAVGVILAVALVVAPAGSARLWTDNVAAMTWLATAIAIGSAVAGLHASRAFDLAAGGAISLIAATVFVVSLVLAPRRVGTGRWRRRRPVTSALP